MPGAATQQQRHHRSSHSEPQMGLGSIWEAMHLSCWSAPPRSVTVHRGAAATSSAPPEVFQFHLGGHVFQMLAALSLSAASLAHALAQLEGSCGGGLAACLAPLIGGSLTTGPPPSLQLGSMAESRGASFGLLCAAGRSRLRPSSVSAPCQKGSTSSTSEGPGAPSDRSHRHCAA